MIDDFERQWLADLPDEWVEKRADFLCNPYRVTVDPAILGDALVAHYSIPHVQETGGPFIEPASDIDSTKLLIDSPTVLVSKLNPRKKTICIAEPHPEYVALASSEFVAINSDVIEQRYAYYVWSSEKVADRLSAIVQSATRSHQRVLPADISKLPWKWPTRDAQQRIARFLDEKTARIDALIEKKQALLERLAERRRTLVTQAVTLGLDQQAKMDLEARCWSGCAPVHWKVKRLKYAFESCKNGTWGSEPDDEDVVACIRAADLDGQTGRLLNVERTMRMVDEATLNKVQLRSGDLILEKSGGGEKQLVGRAAIFDDAGPSVCSNFLARCRPSVGMYPRFLNYLMLAVYLGRGTFPHIKQSTGIQNLDAASFFDIRIAVPHLQEQVRIASFIDDALSKIDEGVSSISYSVERLLEWRNALITAAVTGQLPELKG